MLFRDYLSGGQKLPKNLDMSMGTGAVVDHNNFPDSFLNDGSLKTHDLVGTAEDAARELIDSGHPEYSGPVSDSDSYNAYMLSDNTRYNFETGTVQVLAQRVEGGIAWQNISDVSPELAAKVSNDIIDANNERKLNLAMVNSFPGGNTTPSEASPGAPAASPVANTPASTGGQQSESGETATVTVDTQAPLGTTTVTADTQAPLGTTEEESDLPPNSVLSVGFDFETNESSTNFTDDDGNLLSADIDFDSGDAVISDEAGNPVMVGNINTITGETDFVDADGEVVPEEDVPIEAVADVVDDGRPGVSATVQLQIAGESVGAIRTPMDGGGEQTFHDNTGAQFPSRPLDMPMPIPGMPGNGSEPELDPVGLGNSNGNDNVSGNPQVDNTTDAAHLPQNQQTGQGAESIETFASYFGDLITEEVTVTQQTTVTQQENETTNNRNGTSGSGGTASAASAGSMGTGVSPTGSDVEGTPF